MAGSLQTRRFARADLLGNTCRGKALWVGKVVLIDEGAAEAILVLRERHPANTGWHRGARQGASEVVRQLCAWLTTPGQGGTVQRGGARRRRAGRQGGAVSERPKLEARRQARAQPRSDCRKVVRCRTGEPYLHGYGKHPAVSAAQVARSEVERSTGARVVSRLQRSERSIFSAPSRRAARQTEVGRSSAKRPHALDGTCWRRFGRTGARTFART